MPYFRKFGNTFFQLNRTNHRGIEIVPLAVTDFIYQGIIKLPYFNTTAYQHFLMFFEVGLLFYAKIHANLIFCIFP
jgi:hypothetical protein